MNKKPKRFLFIGYFDHHPILDKLVALVVKPLCIAGLYFGASFTSWICQRWGMTHRDIHAELMEQALRNAFEKKGLAFFYAKWALTIALNIAAIDTAYNNASRRFMHEFFKLAVYHKIRGYEKFSGGVLVKYHLPKEKTQ